jgi:hypothetical protein
MQDLPTTDGQPPESSRFVRWLRVLKLVLTIVVLAIAVWKGLGL